MSFIHAPVKNNTKRFAGELAAIYRVDLLPGRV